AESDAVVAADIGRADLPASLAPAELPWVTWVTTGRIPSFAAAGPNDRLLVADTCWIADATTAGWSAGRGAVAGLPLAEASSSPNAAALAIIANTCITETPESVTEYSSHTLLWEKIQHLIARDPFAIPDDPAEWVRKLATADGINPDSVDVPLFVT